MNIALPHTTSRTVVILFITTISFLITSCQSLDNGLNKLNVRIVNQTKLTDDVKESIRNVTRIVVLVPNSDQHKEINERKAQIEGLFIGELLGKGFEVVTRSDNPKIFKEWELSKSGLTGDSVRDVGKLLNVDAIVIPQITVFVKDKTSKGATYISKLFMTTKLIDVQSGKNIWIITASFEPNLLNLAVMPIWILRGGYNKFEALSIETLRVFPAKNELIAGN